MSPTSCRCSTPLQKYTAGPGTRPGSVVRRRRQWHGRRGRRRGRCGEEVQTLVRLGVAVEPGFLLVRSPRSDRLHILLIALVLCGEHDVLMAQIGHLLAELVPDVRLLGEGDAGPDKAYQHHSNNDCVTRAEGAGAQSAGGDHDSVVSHAGSLIRTLAGAEGDYSKRPWASDSLPSAEKAAPHRGRGRSCPPRAATPLLWRNELGSADRRPSAHPRD